MGRSVRSSKYESLSLKLLLLSYLHKMEYALNARPVNVENNSLLLWLKAILTCTVYVFFKLKKKLHGSNSTVRLFGRASMHKRLIAL